MIDDVLRGGHSVCALWGTKEEKWDAVRDKASGVWDDKCLACCLESFIIEIVIVF